MTQGWSVDIVADTITFFQPPANGAAIVVSRFGSAGFNATDLWSYAAWNPGFGYPGEVEFFADRLVWACSPTQPQTLWFSRTANYANHGKTTPLLDTDSITITYNGRQVNAIRELVPLASLMIMTTSAEIKLTTGGDEVVAPGKVGFSLQSYYGSGRLSAQVVGDQVLYMQGRGFTLRDLGFQFTKDGYAGNDLTVYASHLVEGFTIVDTAFQQVPYSALHLVRSDGKLLTVTYLREQEVVGWALHETDGKIFTVCTIPMGNENAVYYGVERTINGVTRRYIERLSQRTIADVRDAFFVDCGLTFDGRAQAGVQTLTGGTTWEEDEVLRLTSSVPVWVGVSDQGDYVRGFVDGESVDLLVLDYVSSTQVDVQSVGTVPVALRGAFASWDLMRSTIVGAGHLEGKTVAVLGDGSRQSRKVVLGGSFELDVPCAVVQFGLPYRSLIETLDINVPGGETVRDRPKLITRLGILVKDTRGLRAGPDENTLDDVKLEWSEEEGDPTIPLETGLFEYTISATWDKNGRVVVVQDDPLPATVLGIIPRVEVGA